MKRSDAIRFALAISDGQASTFKRNLAKIIRSVLFDNFGASLSAFDISKFIKSHYDLEFAPEEIIDAIKSDRKDVFLELHNPKNEGSVYTIYPEQFQKIKQKGLEDKFSVITKRYIDFCKDDCIFSAEAIMSIIQRYIYSIFNSDINTVLSLMNYKYRRPFQEYSDEQLTVDEMKLINEFLNWDDFEKNEFVFGLISSCYEYCMMTVKKDNLSYASIFNGKEFYLDANIIIRLAGFNNSERQEVIEAFLKKCEECKIRICYTNFTNSEIKNLLSYNVQQLKKLLNGQRPISLEAIKSLSSHYFNLDFYDLFVQWIKNPGNKASDYDAFLRHLCFKVEKHIKKMHFVSAEPNESKKDKTEFLRLCEDLSEFKINHQRNANDSAIKVDIENYLLMKSIDLQSHSNSFLDKKAFFITADHKFIDWTQKKNPGSIPTFVLPSVWYSLMLKYSGRSDNDYNAFCHFLNIRIAVPEDHLLDKKEEILGLVLQLDEPVEIKEKIIFDIKEKLQNFSPESINSEDVVSESYSRVIDEKVLEAVENAKSNHNTEIQQLTTKSGIEAKESHASGFELGKADGFKKGEYKTIEKLVKHEAERIFRFNNFIVTTGIVIFFLSLLSALIFLVLGLCNIGETNIKAISFINNNDASISLVSFIISALIAATGLLRKKTGILPTDKEVITLKARNKIEQKIGTS